MAATPGQKKLVEMLLQTREVFDEVNEASWGLLEDSSMTADEARALIDALIKAPERDDITDFRVGGVIDS
jgi:hypothetical protein